MGPTALGIDPWGGGATAPEGQSPLVGWASWPMKAGPACRRSRGTTTTTSIYGPPRSWDNRCHSVTTCNGPGFKRVLIASAADVRW